MEPDVTDVEESQASDEALLARVAARDAAALAQFYDRNAAVAYGVALRVTASVPAAEDAVQEAFLAIWRRPASFDPRRGSARSWLLAIVHNRAVDHVRRRRDSADLPSEDEATPDQLTEPDVWPEVAGRIDAAEVRAALASLPAAQREAIEMAYWGGLTQTQIASRTGLPLGTVKGRMRLGLLALGRALGRATTNGGGGEADVRAVRQRPPVSTSDRGTALFAALLRSLRIGARLLGPSRSIAR